MKTTRSNRFLCILHRFFSTSAIVISFFGVARAAQQSWRGDAATTAWATGTNWVSGTAPASSITTDTALFNQTSYLSQPNAGTTSITGITIGDGTTATAPLALSGTQLTIGASGINMMANAGAVSITSPVTLGAAQTWTVGGGGTMNASGTISGGAFALTKTGTGTLNFSGGFSNTPNIYLTVPSSGTGAVGVQTGANISATNVYLFQNSVTNGTINYNQTGGSVTATGEFGIGASTSGGDSGCVNTATISGGTVSAGTLYLYKWATSTLNVTNAATVNATSLRIGWSDSSPTGTINLGDGSNFTGGTSINDGGTSGVLNVTGWNIQANRNYALNFKGGTLKAGAAGTNWLQSGAFTTATVQDAGGIFDNGGFAVTLGQSISHGGTNATDGGMVFKGAGSTTLTGTVSYNGPTKVLAGSVTLPETVVTNGISVSDGATLAINGFTGATLGAPTPLGNLTLGSTPGAGGGTITFNNFASNSGQQLVDTSNFTVNGAAQGVTINLAGTFSGAGDFPLVTFANPTIGGDGFAALKLGTLPRGVTANLWEDSQILWLQVTGFNPLKWNGTVSGGVWDINTTANWQGIDTKYQQGDIVVFDNTATGGTSVNLTTTVNPASVTVDNSSYTISGSGSIAGTASLNKTGSGTLTLGTSNGYTGQTNISGGTLKVSNANALGATTTGTVIGSGAALDLNGVGLAAEPLTLNGSGISTTGALVNNAGVLASSASPITLGSASSIGGSGSMILSGDITGSTVLTKAGAGVTTFSTRKSYTGGTTVNSGVLELSGGGGAGGAIRGTATINTGGTMRFSTGDATGYDLNSARLTTININGGSLVVGVTNNQTLGAAALTMQGGSLTGVSGSNLDFFTSDNNQTPRSSFSTLASADPAVVSGLKLNIRQNDGLIFDVANGSAPIDLDVQSNISSSTGFTNSQLVKNGAGTMRISGLSTYAVPTVVNAGTLIVPASQGSTAFTLADGATLGINGAPGSSLSTGAMTLGSAGTTTINLNNFGSQTLASNAPIRVTGTLALEGTPTLNINGSFTSAGVFPVVSYAGLAGSADFVLGSVPRSVTGASLNWNSSNNTYDLTVGAVNPVFWNGNVNGVWDTSTTNWLMNAASTAYQDNDVLVLNDSAAGATAITLNATVTPNSLTVDNTTKNYSITGTGGIAGTGGLTKSGTGSLTLATANTFSGGTTVNAGTLQLGNGTSNGSVAGNITNNASLVLNNGGAQTYSGIISGTGSLTKSGGGTFTLGGDNTYAGTTTISGGTLRVGSGLFGSLGTGAVTNNANLEFYRDSTVQGNPAGSIGGSGNVTYSGPSAPYSLGGQFIVDDANSYTGTTTVTSNARVNLTTATGLGTGPVVVNNGGQILFNAAGATTYSNPMTISGFGWPEPTHYGALRLTNGTKLTGPITLAADARITAFGSSGTLAGVISGNANLDLYAAGNAQILVISGNSGNTYTGLTTISNVQVALNKSSGLAITGDIVLDNTTSPTLWPTTSSQLNPSALLTFTGNSGNARFNLMGTTQTLRGIVNNTTASTAVIQNSEGVGAAPNTSPVDYGTSNLVLNVPSGEDYSFLNGYLRNQNGVVNLVKNGLGRQTLGGGIYIDYNGTTNINSGELRFYDMDDCASRALTVASGATLRIEALTTTGRNFNGNIYGGAVWSGTGTVIMTGAGIKQFNGNAATNISFGSGALVDVQQGVLRLGNGSQLNMSANRADLNVASGATFNAWDSANAAFDALTGSGTVTRGFTSDVSTNSSGTGNLIVGVDNGSGTFSGNISDQVNNAGSILNLVKRGSGTQTLTGINDYDGTTRVEAGTLALSGSGDLTSSSGITVLPGALFDVSAKSTTFTQATGKSLTAGRTSGTGNDIVGNFNTGGTINVASGSTAGTLTFGGDLSLTGGGNLQLDISPSTASGNDKIAVAGALNLTGTTSVTPIFNGTPDTTNPYTIMTYTGALAGTGAANLASGLVNSRYALSFNTDTPNEVRMNVTGAGMSLVWKGTANTTWAAPATLPDATTLNWQDGASADQNFQNLDSVLFDDSATGTGALTVSLTSTVTPAAVAVNNPTRDYTISGTGGAIAGGGSLTKSGAGALTLATTGANTYSGGTTLNAGTLNIGNGGNESATALGAGLVTLNGGTLWFKPGSSSTTFSFANSFALNGGKITGEDGIQRIATGTGASVNVGASGGTLQATWSGKDLYVDGVLTGSGPLAISHGPTSGSASTVHIGNPANTYNGTVSVGGTGTAVSLSVDHVDALRFSTINLNPGGTAGTLVLGQAGTTTLPGLTGTAGTVKPTGAGTYTLNLDIASPASYGGLISDNTGILGLTKNGTGTMTLAGANTFSGQTRVLSGTLALTNASALGGSTLVWDNLGGSLDISTLTSLNIGGLSGAQNLTLPSAITALTIGSASNSDTAVYTGTINMPGTGATFTKQGLGNLTLGGSTSNTWAGNTSIISNGAPGNSSQGNLYLAKTGGAVAIPANTTVNLGTGTNTGQPNLRTLYDNQFGANVTMNFGNTTGGYCRFDLLGTTQSLAAVTGTAGGAIIQNSGLGRYTGPDAAKAATLVLTGSGTYNFTGIIRDTDDGANPLRRLNIQKTGTGTQTFSAANAGAFTGSTIVDAGTLVINRSATGDDYYSSTAYSVATGATLQFDASASGRLCSQVADITGNGTIRKTGAGITYLANNGSSTQLFLDFGTSGLVDVQGGNLNSISTRATNKADVQIAGGATLNINGGGISSTTACFDGLNGGSSSSNATLEIGRTTVLGVNGDGGTFFGNITGAGGITKQGAATLTLSAANSGSPAVPTSSSSFSGDITLNGGKLIGAAKGSVFGSASNTRTITLNAGTTMEFQGPNAFGGHSGSNTPTFVINNATLTNADPLATNVINNGLRNVTLNNGTITATAGNGTSTIDGTTRPGEGYGCWGLNGTVTSSGTSLITSSATGMAGRILLGSGVNTTMNVVDGVLTVSAPLQAGDSGSLLGGLIKTGTGKLVLSAANIYSSPTTVNGGTLELTGSLLAASGVTSPSNITVNAGATLKGTGTAAGTLAANGIVAPGSSIGTLSVGATTFSATGSLSAEINSSSLTADKLAVTGNLNIDPAATLNVTDLGSGTPTSAKLVLVSYTGAWDGGTFAGTTNGGSVVVNGNTYTIKYDDTDAGVNAVTLRIGSSDPFDSWASGYGLTGPNALKGADPDGDGVKNILEFATAGDPTSGSSGPRIYPLMFTIGADNALTFTTAVRKNAVFAPTGNKQTATQDLLVYTVEASNDLVNWTTVQVTEVTGADKTNIQAALGTKLTAPPLGADWEWHTFRTDGGAQMDPSDHIRLKVNEAP